MTSEPNMRARRELGERQPRREPGAEAAPFASL
eukprot:COSAG04_NODE_29524_length_268_cov_0.911243_1_plen_32_part_01